MTSIAASAPPRDRSRCPPSPAVPWAASPNDDASAHLRSREAVVDLGVHDLAFVQGMIESAQQRGGEQLARVLKPGELIVELGEALSGDHLPCRVVVGVEDSLDVVERQAGV